MAANTLRQNRAFLGSSPTLGGLVPLFCVLTKDAHKIYFLTQLNNATAGVEYMIVGWLLFQVCFSYIFGLISDKYCRKKTLVFTLAASLVSLALIQNQFFWLALIVDGILGNVTPVAKAAYCDVHIVSRRVPNILNTFIAQAIPWIIFPLVFLNTDSSFYLYTMVAISVASLILSITLFNDFRDKNQIEKSIIVRFFKKYSRSPFVEVVLAFIIINTAWWSILYYKESHYQEIVLQKHFMLVLGIAFLAGCLLSKYLKFKAKPALFLSFLFLFMLIAFDWIISYTLNKPQKVSSNLFLYIALIGGVLIPNLYCLFGENARTHEQGSVFGFLDGVQTLSEFLGAIAVPAFILTERIQYKILLPVSLVSLLLTLRLYKISSKKNS